MKWLEKIGEMDGRLAPIFIDEKGLRNAGSLRDFKGSFPRSVGQAATVKQASLKTMKAASAEEYLDAIGLKHADPKGHQVLQLQDGSQRILIPAAVLLLGLVGAMAAVATSLLEPGSLARIASPVIEGGEIRMRFNSQTRLSHGRSNLSVRSRFTWLTCFPSARRFWASVYRHGTEGRLAIEPPMASVDAAFYGYKANGAVIATRMSVSTLLPNEPAMPFAEKYMHGPFSFHARGDTGANNLGKFRQSGRPHPGTKHDAELPVGFAGFAMTINEWGEVHQALKRAGFRPRITSKPTIDVCLEKYGCGKPWSTMGPRWDTCRAVHEDWKRNGQWEVVKAVLKEMRG